MAILTALTLGTVFRRALRQTEGLIGSFMVLLGLDLVVPDHSTLSRHRGSAAARHQFRGRPPPPSGQQHRAQAVRPRRVTAQEHDTRVRQLWRKLHLGVNADTERIVASLLTTRDVDDSSQVGPLLDQIEEPLASFRGERRL